MKKRGSHRGKRRRYVIKTRRGRFCVEKCDGYQGRMQSISYERYLEAG
jgi:hypothetical protein